MKHGCSRSWHNKKLEHEGHRSVRLILIDSKLQYRSEKADQQPLDEGSHEAKLIGMWIRCDSPNGSITAAMRPNSRHNKSFREGAEASIVKSYLGVFGL